MTTELLNAEKEASEIVAQARRKRQERLREAKAEAENDIKAERDRRRKMLDQRKQEGSSTAEADKAKVEQDAQKTINEINAVAGQRSSLVEDMLYSLVTGL